MSFDMCVLPPPLDLGLKQFELDYHRIQSSVFELFMVTPLNLTMNTKPV
jgi:hypothetical protein